MIAARDDTVRLMIGIDVDRQAMQRRYLGGRAGVATAAAACRCVLVSAVLLCVATSAAAGAAGSPLTVVSFNLLHGGVFSGRSGDSQSLEARLDLAVSGLAALDPDIIGLQEASAGPGRGNTAARLAARLRMRHVYAPAGFRVFRVAPLDALATAVMNLSEGPALLSRFPILSSRAYDLPRCGRLVDPRVLLVAVVSTPQGPLRAASVHTSGDACLIRSVARILDELHDALPTVLAGDLNTVPDAVAMQSLIRPGGFVDTFGVASPGRAGATVWQRIDVPWSTVARRVDYVLVRPGRWGSVEVDDGRVVLDAARVDASGALWPSDHRGVLARVRFATPATP